MEAREWQRLALRDEDWKRMRRTTAGAMAHFIDEMLYAMGDLPSTYDDKVKVLTIPVDVFIGSHLEDWITWEGREKGEHRADTKATLREIGKLLEAIAMRGDGWRGDKQTVHGIPTTEEVAP